MLNAQDKAFMVYIVNKTKDHKLKKLASKMADNRTYVLPFQKAEFERIGEARREFESRILNKFKTDPEFLRDFIDQVGSMSVMTSDYAKLKTIVNKLHVVAISQLSASAAQSALNEIFGDL